MANFLFYSDYIRFIDDLKECREVRAVADSMNDFFAYYIKDNPSLFYIFLDAIFKIYPAYDMQCEVDLLMEYDEEKFSDYSDPRLEFIAQYAYYLTDNYYEKQLYNDEAKDLSQEPYDFEVESSHISEGKQDSISNLSTPVSFNIEAKYKCNIIKIVEEVNDTVIINNTPGFGEMVSEILTSTNLTELPNVQRRFDIRCKTNFFVYLLTSIAETFRGYISADIFDSVLFIQTYPDKNQFNGSYFNTVKSRNNNKKPLKADYIDDSCLSFGPDKYKC